MAQSSVRAKIIGVAAGVTLPCLWLGYTLGNRWSQAPPPGTPTAMIGSPATAAAAPAGNPAPGAVDPVANMSIGECRVLYDETTSLHQRAVTERAAIAAKMQTVEARIRANGHGAGSA
ncbi:hypothetical protein AMAG_18982 [Allomyces macrogynus ATCC 38327]|uniref:Uncharacterized protein n=1 Tax=Allomyces macrogynus (strain ATCC 38327) TaxID=578462 RepID=A0A0L0SLG0_ALLM3|nr:hypothetical protein AMAG_18982 [Allomyces macrogynus ATCC 38327]|eukprot:KNE63278.1 hypothetical protein AMAG_18982 [Allomyces macrogynus ATCC 38327]